MEIYHVETQEAYDELMNELEEKGHKWLSGKKPTSKNYWIVGKENSCINISSKYITFMNIEQSKKQHPNIPIIEYKAKGENMTQEEMKHNLHELEADLQEAKSSAKKLIEKIDEYLESLKPKFNVGDYVTVDVNGKTIIAKIDALMENKEEAHGLWYDKTEVNVKQDYWFLAEGSKFRHATTEEITEYELALQFHEHGRDPFEVRQGDILSDSETNIFFVNEDIEIWNKEDFISGDVVLVKTAEEVNEWLENK